ncbi:hypothetical protein K1719_033456 [Acacia pycnantha]|nr:hypothetical protein K1719_033456 [Acacia pycnantha]
MYFIDNLECLWLCFAGQNFGRKFYGGIGIHGMKGRSQFSVASVATHVNSVEQQILYHEDDLQSNLIFHDSFILEEMFVLVETNNMRPP